MPFTSFVLFHFIDDTKIAFADEVCALNDFLSRIHADENLRLAEFPIAQNAAYLAHAAVSPLPKCVGEAMSKYVQAAQLCDQETAMQRSIESARNHLAKFLKVSPNELAFVGATSNGLSMIAAGFPFERGENVLIYRDDYPSNVYPWIALKERGIEIRSVNPKALGMMIEEDILEKIDGQTRLVALSSCHYLSGFRIDLDAIGAALHKRGIAFCVDGIQSLGAFEMSLRFVDFMAAGAHKWMLGPCGAGVLFISNRWQKRICTTTWGWNNIACPGFIAADSLEYVPSAKRFEAGTPNLIGLVGLTKSIERIDSIGILAIEEAIVQKRALLLEEVQNAGYEVMLPSIPQKHWGGMLSFRHSNQSNHSTIRRLRQAGVVFSLRQTRDGREWIRFSPHFYNSKEELDLAISCL